MKTLAIYSNKGGVGKTATTVNLAYLAAQSGLSTLICDLDPQSSATYYFRIKPKLKAGHKGFIKGGKPIRSSIKGTDYDHLDLLPADFTHRNLDITFDRLKHSNKRLDRIIAPLKDDYDLIIFDCPPTINILAENIFNVADNLLVPLIPTVLSQRTHQQLIAFLKQKRYKLKRVNSFFSMVDRRKKMHLELMQTMSKELKGMLQTSIPYLSDVEKMGIAREPVPAFAPNSISAKAYQALWDELKPKIMS
ncbi:AAA family ATPase [Anaerolineales bacterium HSG6]|nr:AAA family ATPase [Anaerolineales bacterium HSG6]MDM8531536.1 AAA family ATPase [Anaerolineales bacterium HSG25]